MPVNGNPRSPSMLNAFTIDVEDYYQVSAFEDRIDRDHWVTYPSRVVSNTLRLLDLLDEHSTRATLFVLGWTAAKYPRLVEEMHNRGHELGSHSYWHRLVYHQTPDEFRSDLRDSIKAIEDAAGVTVNCYRAPSFSITKRSQWALDILVEEGISVDSSIYPIYHDRYGMPDSEPGIHSRLTQSGQLVEFPPAVLKTRVGNVPVSGGGYFRLYPQRFTASCIRRVNGTGQPFMFYVHPWEVDPSQPKVASNSRLKTWRHRVNLKSTYSKLDSLLARFTFGTMSDALRDFASLAPGKGLTTVGSTDPAPIVQPSAAVAR